MEGIMLSKQDFQHVRGFLRWAGMGVQPAIARANSVIEVVSVLKDNSLAAVASVAEDLRRGVMVSKESCKSAEAELQRVYAGQKQADGEFDQERQHD